MSLSKKKHIHKYKKNKTLKGGSEDISSVPKVDIQLPLDFIKEKLTTERKPSIRKIEYKHSVSSELLMYPATNNEYAKLEEKVRYNTISFVVSEIFEILESSTFFNNIYLPTLESMKGTDSKTGLNKYTWKTNNKVHREFGDIQINGKINQYYTLDKQISMKKETFYEQSVDELWEWYLDKYSKITELKAGRMLLLYPLNYSSIGDSILTIVKTTFINVLSKIINSYIKYGQIKNNNYEMECKLFAEFIKLLDKLYDNNSNPTPIYGDLIKLLLKYFEYFEVRLEQQSKRFKSTLKKIKLEINQNLNKKILILPFVNGLNYFKSVKAFTIPIIYANICPDIGHYVYISPTFNFLHDIAHYHEYSVIEHNGFSLKKNEELRVFYTELEKLQKIHSGELLNVINYLVFSLVHESATFFPVALQFIGYDISDIKETGYNFSFIIPLLIYIYYVNIKIVNDTLMPLVIEKKDVLTYRKNPFVKQDELGNYYICGTPEHLEYMRYDLFVNAVDILNEIFIRTSLYSLYNIGIKKPISLRDL